MAITEAPKERAVDFVHSGNFPELLRSLKASLFVTTYQAQRILVISPGKDRLSMLMRVFPRPTGMAISESKLALSAKHQMLVFERVYDVRDLEGTKEPYDFCFSPRISYICGDVQGHEVAFINGELHFINTRFNCLSRPSTRYSFEVVWKPKFITELVPEDRCHLNGMALENNTIRYCSCLSKGNVKDHWRDHKRDGGIVINYSDSEVVTSGLSMPHSPRLHGGKLWILNSGRGQLEIVDTASGKRTAIAVLPGFLRGLAFVDRYAFIGLSKIRESNTFGGLEIQEKAKELECAVYCIDISQGTLAGFIKFTKGVEELFDVKILQGSLNPHVIGFEEDTVDGLFVPPPA